MTRKYHRSEVSREKFIEVWNAAHSSKEVAEALGMSVPAATVRASSYRNKGFALKIMSAHGRRRVRPDRVDDIARRTRDQ